jgi:hypothetical protein
MAKEKQMNELALLIIYAAFTPWFQPSDSIA